MKLQRVDFNENCQFCQENKNLWDFLDAAVVICLEDRSDRHLEASKELHRTGLCQIASFYRATRDKRGFTMGCWDSTSQVCSIALSEGLNNILSLEDDFEMDKAKSAEEVAKTIKNAMTNLPTNWKRLSLGHVSWFKMHYASNLDRAMSVLTHAQIWSIKGMEWMIQNNAESRSTIVEKLGVQVDGFISLNCKNSYSIKPMITFQKNLESDRNAGEQFCQEPNMIASEWYIPLIWTFVCLLIVFMLFLIFHNVTHLSSWNSMVVVLCIVVIPFLVIWGLILTNEI